MDAHEGSLTGDTWRGAPRGASLGSSLINLLKCTIGVCVAMPCALPPAMLLSAAATGTGILVLPYEFAQTGWLLAFAVLAALAAASVCSLNALSEVRRASCATTYTGCVRVLLGARAARCVDAFQAVYMLGALIATLGILLDQLATVAPSAQAAQAALCAVSACALFPLTLLRGFESLCWSSGVGVVSLLCLTCLAAAHVPWRAGGVQLCAGADAAEALRFQALRPAGVPGMLGATALSYECQVNFLPLLAELRNPTRARVWAFAGGAIASALLYYGITALLTYMTFCSATAEDMLDSYGAGGLAAATRVTFAVQTAASFPLTSIVLRDVLDSSLPPHAPAERRARHAPVRFKAISCGIVLVSTAVAALRPPLQAVMALTGAVGGSALAFVFPGLLLFEARRRAQRTRNGSQDLSAALLTEAEEEEEVVEVASKGALVWPLLFAAAGVVLALWSSWAVLAGASHASRS
jgi:amino acid permease